jgi:hypothetical protein
MVFLRRLLPARVSAFLEAAQLLPAARHRRLWAHGTRGLGVVTRHDVVTTSQSDWEIGYSVRVRFRFDDGTEAEIIQGCVREKIGKLEVGDTVPVRFDPGNHSAVVLDMPALQARHREKIAAADAARKRADDEKIARAQARIEGRGRFPGDRLQ